MERVAANRRLDPGLCRFALVVLAILLVIFLLGGFSGRFGGYGYGFGHGGIGVIGIILIIVVVLAVTGRL